MDHLMSILHIILPAATFQKILAVIGAASLLTTIVPRLLSWGVPASVRGADWLANLVLNSPLRALALWQAPAICSFLDNLTAALIQIISTFKGELEADLAKAQDAKTGAENEKKSA